MSALGQKQTCASQNSMSALPRQRPRKRTCAKMSALPPKADLVNELSVLKTPRINKCPQLANLSALPLATQCAYPPCCKRHLRHGLVTFWRTGPEQECIIGSWQMWHENSHLAASPLCVISSLTWSVARGAQT